MSEPTELRAATARSIVAAVLITLGTLLAVIAPIGAYAKHTLSDPSAFTASLDQFRRSPAFADYLVTQVRNETTRYLDTLAEDTDNPIMKGIIEAARPYIEEQASEATRTVVASPEFERLWDDEITRIHGEILALLDDDPANDPDGVVVIHAGPIADLILAELQRSLPFTIELPSMDVDVPIADSAQIEQLRPGYQTLNTWGYLLGVGVVVFLALGIAVAPRRLLALAGCGVGLVGSGIASMLVSAPLIDAITEGAGSSEVPANVTRAAIESVTAGLSGWQWPQIIVGVLLVAGVGVVWAMRKATQKPRRQAAMTAARPPQQKRKPTSTRAPRVAPRPTVEEDPITFDDPDDDTLEREDR